MKWVFAIIVFVFTACDLLEVNKAQFADVYPNGEIKYVLYLRNDSLLSYEMFEDDVLKSKTRFVRQDSVDIDEITSDYAGNVLQKRSFKLISDTLVKISLDSLFYPTDTIVYKNTYVYAHGYLSQSNKEHVYGEVLSDSANMRNRLRYHDENVIATDVIVNGSYCTNRFEYTSYPNVFDIEFLANGWFGRKNKNLRYKINWQASCFKDDYVTAPMSTFVYVIDSKGFVLEKTETFTPSYHTSMDKEVTRLIYHTSYDYVFE